MTAAETLTDVAAIAHDILAGDGRVFGERRIANRLVWIALWQLHEHGGKRDKFEQAVIRDYKMRYGSPIIIFWLLSIVINLVWQWWLDRREADVDEALKLAARLRATIKANDWPE